MSATTGNNDPSTGWDRLRSKRLNKYERVALELFAARGFGHVSVDDIAAEVGVSSRTLYRYFPTKEDFLLGYVRRNLYDLAAAISSMPISDEPLSEAWKAINEIESTNYDDIEILSLWRAAARTAPNVTAAAAGERAMVLIEELVDYFAKCWNLNPDDDPRPRLAAGVISGIELTTVLAIGRTKMTRKQFDAAIAFSSDALKLIKQGH